MELRDVDIKKTLDLIEFKEKCYIHNSRYSSPFLFGTENHEGINNIVDYANKDVLTVASSGDQYLSAIYYGAKVVDLFDINRLTYYMNYLKIAAIYILSYEEFLNFFVPVENGQVKKGFFDYILLKKLLPVLPDDVALFWDKIIYEVSKDKINEFLNVEHIINHFEIVKRGMPFYSCKEEYYKLQNLLKNRNYPKFYEVNLSKLSEVVVDKYDVVFLSNIIEHIVCREIINCPTQPFNLEDIVEKLVFNSLKPQILSCLRPDGIALIDYRANKNNSYASNLIYNNDFFDKSLISSKLPVSTDCDHTIEDVDVVLTYKPSSKKSF